MSWATSEVVAVLTFLLPGFVGAAVFYALTSRPTPSELDRVVQAEENITKAPNPSPSNVGG